MADLPDLQVRTARTAPTGSTAATEPTARPAPRATGRPRTRDLPGRGPAGSGTGSGASFDNAILLDSYAGTDDAKLDQAWAAAQASNPKRPIRLAARAHTFTKPRTTFSGLRILGPNTGWQNPEIAGTNGSLPQCVVNLNITRLRVLAHRHRHHLRRHSLGHLLQVRQRLELLPPPLLGRHLLRRPLRRPRVLRAAALLRQTRRRVLHDALHLGWGVDERGRAGHRNTASAGPTTGSSPTP